MTDNKTKNQMERDPSRNRARFVATARNVVALVVTLGGAALLMFAPWWWVGPNALFNVSLFASVIGLIASISGRWHGAIWYVVWMFGLLVCDEINNAPHGDPGLILGAVLHGMAASPMILIGFLVNFVKNRNSPRSPES